MCIKTLLPFFIFTLITFSAFSQVRFENGYFIDNQDKRTECLIRNVGWDDNPDSFRYKLPTGEEIFTANIADVKEFGVEGKFAYVRQEVKIDTSPTDLKLLSHNRNPVWEQRVVFVNTLVNGDAKLFLYKAGSLRQYYIQKADGQIVPLVFKRYVNDNNQVQTNFGFRQQLLNELKCESLTEQYLTRVNYIDSDLVKSFQKFNSCQNPIDQPKPQLPVLDIFKLKWKPGVDVSLLSTKGSTFVQDGSRKAKPISFRMGIEAEYLAGFNQNKWALVLDPAFQYYKFPLRTNFSSRDVNFWSVDAPVGIRHYLYLSEKSRFFVDGFYTVKITNQPIGTQPIEIRTGTNGAFGAGIAVGELSLEARYYLKRYIETSNMSMDADFAKFSLILGYTFISR